MPDFRCRLATASGQIVERDYSAPDADVLRRDLERQDYLVLSIQRRSSMALAASGLLQRRRKVKLRDFLIFNQEFAALVRAGLPIVEALGLLIERRKQPLFRAALEDVRDRVRAGESLSDAFEAQGVFPPLYASALASGERSGEIATVIGRYVAYAQTIYEVRKKVVSALTYPLILVGLSIGLAFLLLLYVLPRFEEFFEGFNTELPAITVAVLGLARFLQDYGLLVAAGFAATVVLFVVWRRTPVGRRASERALYRLPVVGPTAQKFVQTRFCRTLGTLVAGGIPLVTCLETLQRSIGSAVYEDAIRTVTNKIREGAALWQSLEETGLFSDMAIEMIKVGESSGSLPEMLAEIADFLDRELETDLQTMVSLFEPILLVTMALMVGSMLLAIYMPLLQIYSNATT